MNAPLLAGDAPAGLAGSSEVRAALAAADAARAAKARSLAGAAGTRLYGSFWLGGQEFALDAACIREVVGMPARITRLPLSPACLEGVFTLRGHAIPMLNLARVFDPAAAPAGAEQRVAILEHEEVLVGLVFDATGEVLRVRPEQHTALHYGGAGGAAVLQGALTLENGARLVQLLDPAALIRIDNVPQVRAQSAARDAERLRFLRRAQGRKALAFRAGGMAFAMAIEAVQEIIRVPELRQSVMLGKLCKGWFDLRGTAVGAVDLGALLQCAPEAEVRADERRVMIVRAGGELLGLLVDAVEDIRPYFDSDVLAIPMLGTRRAAMFRGVLPDAGRGDALFLDHAHLFSEGEVAEICAGHRRLYQHELDGAAGHGAAARRRQVYLAFTLDTGWATDIGQVREIVAFDEAMTRPPGMPDCVHGMMQLRQQMICVIDLRRMYGMPARAPLDQAAAAERRVLVLDHGEERYGVIVDRVDSILSLPDSQRRPSPALLRVNGPADMRRDAGEVLEVPGEGGKDGVLTLFDKTRFLATLRGLLEA